MLDRIFCESNNDCGRQFRMGIHGFIMLRFVEDCGWTLTAKLFGRTYRILKYAG